MSDKLLGTVLMASVVLFWAFVLARAFAKNESHIEINLVTVVVSVLCWMIGRILAGASLLSLAIG